MTAFQPLMKLPGHPLVVRLKKMKKSGQLHQLCLKKINHIPLLLLCLPNSNSSICIRCEEDQGCRACSSEEKESISSFRFFNTEEDEEIDKLISSVPSKEIVPFDEEYVIPSGSDEENPSAASSEQMDEEIEADQIPSTLVVSSPMP